MPLALTCPHCHAPQTVPDEDAGRPVRCSACGADFTAGAAAPPAARPRRRRGGLLWVVVAAVLLGAVGLAAYQFAGRSAPATDFTDPDGVFSARFPGAPEEKVVAEARPLFMVWGERVYRAKAGGKEYSVAVLDSLNTGSQPYGPATRDTHILQVIAVTGTNTDGQTVLERPADHEGHAAREAVLAHREGGTLTALRVVAGGRHVLRLAVTGSGDKDKAAAFLDRAGEFFATVHLGPAFGAPVTEPVAVSAAELAAAYRAAAGAADAKYKDRWLLVTGPVREVAEDGTEFLMGGADGVVLVRRAPPARQSVPVRRGATVEVTAKCRGAQPGAAGGASAVLEDAIVSPPQPK